MACDDTTILQCNYMWAVTYTYILHLHKISRHQCTDIHWVFLHLAEPICVAWHSCTVQLCSPTPNTGMLSLQSPSHKIYKKMQRSTISHLSTYLSAAISHAMLLYSTTLMFLAVNKAILQFSASFLYEVIHNTNHHVSTWFISTCIPQSCPFIWLTTATTSTIGCARDMLGSASWPIGKTPFLKSRCQTRYPEAQRFNCCLLCLRETSHNLLESCGVIKPVHLLVVGLESSNRLRVCRWVCCYGIAHTVFGYWSVEGLELLNGWLVSEGKKLRGAGWVSFTFGLRWRGSDKSWVRCELPRNPVAVTTRGIPV
jgi:hypothetical protein